MTFTDTMTLKAARDELRTLVDEGHDCPCCRQYAKVYKRTIHAAMARDLIAAWRRFGREWFFLPDLTGKRGTGDVTKCRYWGLLEQQPGRRGDGSNRIGYWRLTEKGERFVKNEVKVERYARIYAGRSLGLIGEVRGIEASLGKKFDYAELMAA